MAADYNDFMKGWNINKGFWDHVVEIIVGTDIACYNDDAYHWYKFLRMIYRKIHNRLKPEARVSIDNQFSEIRKILEPAVSGNSQQAKYKLDDALDALDTLETYMMDQIHEEEMISKKPEYVPPGKTVEDLRW